MAQLHTIATVLASLFAACTPSDSDADGLPDPLEAELGTDPDRADSDGDRLNDGDEHWTQGTDPLNADTDGDGIADGDELDYGLDPNDAASAGYQLGWPMAPLAFKQSLDQRDVRTPIAAGTRFPRIWVSDQAGESVDLYDFAGRSEPTILVVYDINAVSILHRSLDALAAIAIYTPSRDTLVKIDEGSIHFIQIAVVEYLSSNQLETDYLPPTTDHLETACVDPRHGCFADIHMSLWHAIGEPRIPFIWYLLDDEMNVLFSQRAEVYQPPGQDPPTLEAFDQAVEQALAGEL